MIKSLIALFDVAGSVNGKSIRCKKPAPYRYSRKRTNLVIACSLAVTSLAVGIALFAHPWQSNSQSEVEYLIANDMYKMAGINLNPHKPNPYFSDLTECVLAEDLSAPDGLAIEPFTGSIYITEENDARVVRLDPDNQRTVLIDANTPIYARRHGQVTIEQGLRSPEGIAFSRDGKLYIVEDLPGGRLIEFELPEYTHGSMLFGTVVDLPAPANGYAWESVAVSPRGEILLAGSNMEAYLGDRNVADMPSGAVMYRNVEGSWWMPVHRSLESFSGACFTPDGQHAYFISESMGYVGCFDLRDHVLKTWFADIKIESPEGVVALSDGTAVVVSEKGPLYRIDPHDCSANEVYDFQSGVESVAWDPARGRLLFTLDNEGQLTSLNNIYFAASQKIQGPIELGNTTFQVEVPTDCPSYLTGLLNMCGFDPFSRKEGTTFRDLVKNVALFAIDADTKLISSDTPVDDPIKKIQFAIFTPLFFGVDLSGLSGPSSGFAAVRASGEMYRTRLHKGSVMSVNMSENHFSAFVPSKLALPHPAAYRLSPEGTATVNFMGMGETPDFHIILNMKEPDLSYMVVMHPDGKYQQYEIKLPADKNIQHWVVGLKRDNPEAWKYMTATSHQIAKAD